MGRFGLFALDLHFGLDLQFGFIQFGLFLFHLVCFGLVWCGWSIGWLVGRFKLMF